MKLCVFCGSALGSDPAYRSTASEFGRLIASRGWGLVYGGASVGLMGVLADAVMQNGGQVTGIIPRHLSDHEIAHGGLYRLEIVTDMHARKARMAELADVFVALPGGVGTLEELFEVITWGGIGLHRKPCHLFNTNSYYDSLLEFLVHAQAEGFVSTGVMDNLQVHVSLEQATAALDKVVTTLPAQQ